ncbi:MAG: hypothetical protein DWP97_00280 [Calditrichaeota bacterium]|nr:MAG: hypothetical protein DWP97_00280 [Calditrichota bacterium]
MNIDEIQKLISGKFRGKKKRELEKIIEADTELKELYIVLKKLFESSLLSDKKLTGATRELSGKIYSDFQKAIKLKSKKIGVQIFDSSLLPLPEGIRPAAVDTKTLRYLIDGSSLELTVYPITTDSVEIIGVVNFENDLQTEVQVVLKTQKEKFISELDQFSLFRFERIPVGKCRISFYMKKKLFGAVEIEI